MLVMLIVTLIMIIPMLLLMILVMVMIVIMIIAVILVFIIPLILAISTFILFIISKVRSSEERSNEALLFQDFAARFAHTGGGAGPKPLSLCLGLRRIQYLRFLVAKFKTIPLVDFGAGNLKGWAGPSGSNIQVPLH